MTEPSMSTIADQQGIDAIAAVQALTRVSRFLERVSTELSLPDFRVLSAVDSGEARASRVAARLAIGRPTISAAVDSLCKRGLLVRAEVDGDQRAASLTLTAEGVAVRQRVEDSLVDQLQALCDRTQDADRVIESLAWLGTAIESIINERTDAPGESPVPASVQTGRRA